MSQAYVWSAREKHPGPASAAAAEVPITQSYEYWNALRRLGVTTQFVVYPDEGHFFVKRADQLDAMARVVGWFDTYMQ